MVLRNNIMLLLNWISYQPQIPGNRYLQGKCWLYFYRKLPDIVIRHNIFASHIIIKPNGFINRNFSGIIISKVIAGITLIATYRTWLSWRTAISGNKINTDKIFMIFFKCVKYYILQIFLPHHPKIVLQIDLIF